MNFQKLSSPDTVKKTAENLTQKGYTAFVVNGDKEALAKIKELIPAGSSVINGASVTLEQIGFVDYLKDGEHGWNNLHQSVLDENDPAKQGLLRKQATISDYYLGSVHALLESGEFLIASNTGSQLPSIVFNSNNLIFVVGAQKIVPSLIEGFARLENYVVPKEDDHMKAKYGMGTQLNKILIFKGESSFIGRKVTFILVNQELGF